MPAGPWPRTSPSSPTGGRCVSPQSLDPKCRLLLGLLCGPVLLWILTQIWKDRGSGKSI